MRTFIFIILATLLQACSYGPDCPFTEFDHNSGTYTCPDKNSIEYIGQFVVTNNPGHSEEDFTNVQEGLEEILGEKLNLEGLISIHFEEGHRVEGGWMIEHRPDGTPYMGYNMDLEVHVVNQRQYSGDLLPLCFTSLMHELLHEYHRQKFDIIDHEHTDPIWDIVFAQRFKCIKQRDGF